MIPALTELILKFKFAGITTDVSGLQLKIQAGRRHRRRLQRACA